MNTIKEKMYQQIEQHGANLNRIFDTGLDNVTLCKKLRKLEVKAHKLATDYCNGENGVNTDNWESLCEPILKAVRKILKCSDTFPIFVNGDARGYALKIDSDYVEKNEMRIYQDWGHYGILAPEFDGN